MLWWWRGGNLFRAAVWPPAKQGLRRHRVARIRGVIIDGKAVPDGVAALVSIRTAGIRFDNTPRILLVRGAAVSRVTLPEAEGQVLARSIDVAWPQIIVRGVDVTAFTRQEQGAVIWRSGDGGITWRVERT